MKILVAGVGNVLKGDDGFGVEVAHRLQEIELASEVTVVETGIGGLHLVQEMAAGFDALIVVDAVDRGRPPGTVMVIEPEVEDTEGLSAMHRMDYLADMHYTKPAKALMLAKALGILPGHALLVGCQPTDLDRLGEGLSEPVAAAVHTATKEVMALIDEMVAQAAGTTQGSD